MGITPTASSEQIQKRRIMPEGAGQKPKAYRVAITNSLPDTEKAFLVFSHLAEKRYASLEQINPKDFSHIQPVEKDTFQILQFPTKESFSELSSKQPHSKIELDDFTLFHTAYKSLIIISKKKPDDFLPALIYFAYNHHYLEVLESELEMTLKHAQKDVMAIDSGKGSDLKSWKHINEMLRITTSRRISFLDTEKNFKKFPLMSPKNKILFEEIKEAEGIEDRLESAGDHLELFEGLYEHANCSIAEYSYFLREYKLEAWIIVILLAEVALTLFDIFLDR